MSNSKEFENITFDLPKNRSNVIKVIGVGGGGSNAINHMFRQGINGVDFVVCNTDAQALENSPVPTRIQLGLSLTEGMGAGANPQVGEQAALESQQEIQNMLSSQTKMVFITAGMGGGTGTGAAPVIAKIAKEMNILTVGIVTVPFQFEGKMRNEQAQEGVERLRETIDSLIIINNNKLREVYGNLGFKSGFAKADEVLATAARGIAEVITHHYMQNIDLRDAKTVLANSGTAIMGSATAKGANRAQEAITQALDSPLLNDNKITGAKNVLLLIVSGTQEITIDEIGEINDHIQSEAGNNANIIMGVGEDSSQDEAISITIIATGFGVEQQDDIVNTEVKKIIHTLEDDQCAEQVLFSGKIEKPIESIPVERKPKFKANPEELIIKHNLFEDSEQEIEALPFEGYIKTSELIKNIDIVCEEIITSDLNEFNPASILDIGVDDFEIVSSESTDDVDDLSNESNDFAINSNDEDNNTTAQEDEQILMFDIPLNPKVKEPDLSEKTLNPNQREIHHLSETNVSDGVQTEISLTPENTDQGIVHYTLDDFQEEESKKVIAKPLEVEVEVDEDLIFKKKVIEPLTEEENKEVDPMNMPISQLLKQRAEQRKKEMKAFNYKFKNSPSQIEGIEKEPAYKRMGIDLDKGGLDDKGKLSRMSLNTDDDEIQLRNNNSFLHDNVD